MVLIDDSEPYDETGDWPERACATCGEVETRKRCTGCRLPTCHQCDDCANQCGELGPLRWRNAGPPVVEQLVNVVQGEQRSGWQVRSTRYEGWIPGKVIAVKQETGTWINGVIDAVDDDGVVTVKV